MERYSGHLDGVLVSLNHYWGFTWVLYYERETSQTSMMSKVSVVGDLQCQKKHMLCEEDVN